MKLKTKAKLKLLLNFLFFTAIALFVEAKVSFEKADIQIGKKPLAVEVASSREQLSYGLMNRTSLPENYGMLFIFPNEEVRTFWMKDTFVDLSIGFFDKQKKLVDIQDMTAVKSVMEEPQTYSSKKPAMYALEVPRGWFKKNNINPGEVLKFSKPLSSTNVKNKAVNQ